MNENDKKLFIKDFKKADISKKLDMWFYVLEQQQIWEEILSELSNIARIKLMQKDKKQKETVKT